MTSKWERAKSAIKRDWEQTKHDLSGGRKGTDLNQDVGDTVKQAAGKESPGYGTYDFNRSEDAVRYGYGASSYYGDYKEWDEPFESKLRKEWNDLKSGRTWEEIKDDVRYGFNAGRRDIH